MEEKTQPISGSTHYEDVTVDEQHEAGQDIPNDPYIKAIKRKIDLRICLVLSLMYTIAVVDRNNLPVSYLRETILTL